MLRILISFLLVLLSTAAGAQTPPSNFEIEQYEALHKATHFGDVTAIKRLIEEGADLEKRDSAGHTAVHVAAFASNEEALKILASAGADMNALEHSSYDVVTIAAVANDPELLLSALSLGNRADLITSPYVGTALIAAAHLGHHEIINILIKHDAPLDHVNNLGWTALMEAVILGDGGPNHVQTVKLLLKAGADRSIADNGGMTPLAHATNREYTDIVSLFN